MCSIDKNRYFNSLISWADCDWGSYLAGYQAPFAFTGQLGKFVVTTAVDQVLNGEVVDSAEFSRKR